jgi:hypothetical protein
MQPQARALGCQGGVEAATWEDLEASRVACNICATSIPNLHAHCTSCDWDMCINCLEASIRGAGLACPKCGGKRGGGGQSQAKGSKKGTLECKRFFDDEWMAALRAAAKVGQPRGLAWVVLTRNPCCVPLSATGSTLFRQPVSHASPCKPACCIGCCPLQQPVGYRLTLCTHVSSLHRVVVSGSIPLPFLAPTPNSKAKL